MNSGEQERRLHSWLDRHTGLLLKVARSFARNSYDQDDLLQEITLQLWRSIPTRQSHVAESTWIYRVSLHAAINWSKRQSRQPPILDSDVEQPGDALTPTLDTDPRVDWLYDKINSLPPIDRSIALLVLEEVSYGEIADTLGMTENAIGVRIHRIKKKLCQWYESERKDEL